MKGLEDLEDDDLIFNESELKFFGDIENKSTTQLEKEEELIKELFHNIFKFTVLADKISVAIDKISDEDLSLLSLMERNQSELKLEKLLKRHLQVITQINTDIIGLYEFTNEINYFWYNCSIETYTSNFPTMMKRYQEKFKVATPLDLLKSEYEYYLIGENIEINVAQQTVRGQDYLSLLNSSKFLTNENNEFFKLVNKRKMEFLEQELDKLGYTVEVDKSNAKPSIKFIDSVAIVEKDLALSGLPKFNLQQRYEIFKRLKLDKVIDILDTKQMSKYNLLAIILNISPDNCKRLYGNSYKPINSKDLKVVMNFLEKQGVTKKE